MSRGVAVVSVLGFAALTAAFARPALQHVVPPGCRALSGGHYPGRDEAPVFSPDGTRILFNRDWSTMACLQVLNLRTGKLTVADRGLRCTCGPALPGEFGWSPNGREIALTVWTDVALKRMAVEVVTPGRTDARKLASGRFQPGVVWSPDGTQLAVVSFQPGAGTSLRVLDVGTGRVSRVVDVPQGSFEPAWSPDGSRIALWTGEDVDVVNLADGSVETVATQAQDPTWSPDGTRLAFARKVAWQRPPNAQPMPGPTPPTTTEIFVANADGSDPHDIGGGFPDEYSPEWSPDGTSIAYIAANPDPRNPGTYLSSGLDVVAADGTGQRVLIGPSSPIRDVSSFDWSPDGKKIVSEYDGNSRGGLYLIDADGTGLQRLTTTR